MFETTDEINRRRQRRAWYESLPDDARAVVDELLEYYRADGELSGTPDEQWQRYWQLTERFDKLMRAHQVELGAAVRRTATDVDKMRIERDARYRHKYGATVAVIERDFPRDQYALPEAIGQWRARRKAMGDDND